MRTSTRTLFIALVLCAIASIALAQSQSTATQLRKKGEERLKWMLQQSAKTPLISLTPSTYRKFVTSGPRPYTVLVTFTALHSQFQCAICRSLHDELLPLAAWYEQHRYLNQAENPHHLVFFAEVDYGSNNEIFREMQLQQAPLMVYIPATDSGNSSRVATLLKDLPSNYQFNVNKWGLNADGVQKFVVSRTSIGYDVVPTYEPPRDYTVPILVVSTLVLSIILFRVTVAAFPQAWLLWELRKQPMLYYFMGLGVYLFCTSGGMYNIIRGMPFMHVPQRGEESFIFHPDSSMQYGIESVSVAFLYLMCSIMLMLLNSRFASSTYVNRTMVVGGALFGLHYMFSAVRSVYTRKNGSYNYGYVYGL